MKNKIILTALISFGALSVFAHNAEKQETLYGATFIDNSINIIVKSNGCTQTQDFRLEKLNGGDHTLLEIVRIKPDRCKRMPKLMTITLPIDEQRQLYYKINNSFTISKK